MTEVTTLVDSTRESLVASDCAKMQTIGIRANTTSYWTAKLFAYMFFAPFALVADFLASIVIHFINLFLGHELLLLG